MTTSLSDTQKSVMALLLSAPNVPVSVLTSVLDLPAQGYQAHEMRRIAILAPHLPRAAFDTMLQTMLDAAQKADAFIARAVRAHRDGIDDTTIVAALVADLDTCNDGYLSSAVAGPVVAAGELAFLGDAGNPVWQALATRVDNLESLTSSAAHHQNWRALSQGMLAIDAGAPGTVSRYTLERFADRFTDDGRAHLVATVRRVQSDELVTDWLAQLSAAFWDPALAAVAATRVVLPYLHGTLPGRVPAVRHVLAVATPHWDMFTCAAVLQAAAVARRTNVRTEAMTRVSRRVAELRDAAPIAIGTPVRKVDPGARAVVGAWLLTQLPTGWPDQWPQLLNALAVLDKDATVEDVLALTGGLAS